MAPIAVGDTIPDGKLHRHDEYDQLEEVSMHSLAAGKKIVMFGIPGAFTPTCRYICALQISLMINDLLKIWS